METSTVDADIVDFLFYSINKQVKIVTINRLFFKEKQANYCSWGRGKGLTYSDEKQL
jgi:hypothetical protein